MSECVSFWLFNFTRFKQRPALRLVRMGEDYISRVHGADLATKFNPVGQGLDIVEMAAIFG